MACGLASGVSWRCWEDGCVVFSAATAQTLLLSTEFGPVLAAAEAAGGTPRVVPPPAGVVSAEPGRDAASPAHGAAPARIDPMEADRVQRLIELGILEPSA